jgi:hypothetical protein
MGASARVLHSIVCCRILLNLKEAVTPGNTLTEVSTGLAFASSVGQQTGRPETIQLDGAHDTRTEDGYFVAI